MDRLTHAPMFYFAAAIAEIGIVRKKLNFNMLDWDP